MFTSLQLLFGIWLGILSLPGATLPFNFEIVQDHGKTVMIIHNGEERILCKEVSTKKDSLIVRLPLYDSEFRVKVNEKEMNGVWINYGKKGSPSIPFHAVFNIPQRFIANKKPGFSVEGRWETWFNAGNPDSTLAIGVFKQVDEKVSGTFLSESGDHRYLEGIVDGDSLKLSVFDGSHCWLYKARYKDEKLFGVQWSGISSKENWNAKRNDNIQLRNPETITSVEGTLAFRFPDVDSNFISLNDPKYKNKAVILQIMGSWCPNCMDETAFLAEFYQKHKAEGLEIIGLDFERFPEFSRARSYIQRVIDKYEVEYTILFAGVTGKDAVAKALPGIKNFMTYPTTIFIDRHGRVLKVHAGFSGPATGADYTRFTTDFEKTVDLLLR
jgi:thiol-disulfide isomerase/thioredoxin